jgi:hypothetical protein
LAQNVRVQLKAEVLPRAATALPAAHGVHALLPALALNVLAGHTVGTHVSRRAPLLRPRHTRQAAATYTGRAACRLHGSCRAGTLAPPRSYPHA